MRQLIKQRIKNEKGLTLIELLAVIVILGIIAAIAIPSISGIIQKSKEDAVKADAITILNAAKNYVAGNDMAKGGTINDEELSSYVSGVNLEKFDKYTVTVGEGGTTFGLNATNVEAGKINITFTNATIEKINNAKKGQIEIK
ncbi:prepilin-type cleavage/methylation domain-containing protein [Niallia circulans]|uniref:prepilin-type N-terminal cleavage/methylation domain-containing protein n=1 Tax=Niallia TaxID=2837506 RepID=UPI000BA5EED1|nr:prepilin-type N-terminal cleavage/methylation domain-containing protein [Niallia circulans]PAD26220.1 prepilin-type cleavage/methylation domain-containing protein [Niallia circulans]PAD86308.1 prepilin-type cleavage/methylation domain-containing protein [Niallia circulans]PAE11147.1 prepilin-type cleavage/methylation domain-containing protein [Niallia circulans]